MINILTSARTRCKIVQQSTINDVWRKYVNACFGELSSFTEDIRLKVIKEVYRM